MAKHKVQLDEDTYKSLLNRILDNKEEERMLALDRYRKADESMETNEHFSILGRNAVAFLRLASDATNDMASLAKEIKSIVFKDIDKQSTDTTFDPNIARGIIDSIKLDNLDLEE